MVWPFTKRKADAPSAAPVVTVQANSLTSTEDLVRILERMAFQFQSAAGVSVNGDNAETVTAAYRCVRLLSDTVGWLPLKVYRVGPDGRRAEIRDDDRVRLLTVRPNARQKPFQWFAMMQRDLELRGNGYALKVRGVGGRLVELVRLHPDRVSVHDEQGRLFYRYSGMDGSRRDYALDDVLHIYAWSDDGISGKSTIQAHRDTLGEGIALRQHSSKMFANGARPSGILQVAAGTKIGPNASKELIEDFDELYSGTDNAWKTVVLPGGIEYKPVSMNMDDAQYLETRKFTVEEVCRIFGVTPHKVFNLDRATFNNIEHLAIEFVTDSIRPRTTLWQQIIHGALFDDDPLIEVEFDLSYLLLGDAKSRAEAYQIMRRNGVLNANEWREEEGWNRREDLGGDQYIIESNMALNDGRDPSPSPSPAPAPENRRENIIRLAEAKAR